MKYFIMPAALLTVTAAAFIGCSTPAYVEKDNATDLSSYKTYMWVDTRTNENDASARATAYADISIHNAANAELANWGWREVSDNPDVLVSYDVLVQRTTETRSEPVYSQPMTRYYYNNYRRRWGTIYYPSQFLGYQSYETPVREATFTITMVDANSDKKVWQGWTTERLSTSGITSDDATRSVRNIFKESSRMT
jgi:hypothetical protein